MQSIRNAILWHVRAKRPTQTLKLVSTNQMCTTTAKARYTDDDDDDQTMDRVIALVKKFDKIDASKVTETADFQKDLSLDSLDRVELVMAFEQEFAVEIPDEKADKLTCCTDVANYIASTATAMKTTQ